MRARTGHGHEAASFAFKAGDGLYGTFECRTVDPAGLWQQRPRVLGGRSLLPGAGRRPAGDHADRAGDGTQIAALLCRPGQRHAAAVQLGWLRLLAAVENMVSRQPAARPSSRWAKAKRCACLRTQRAPRGKRAAAGHHVACASVGGRILTFEITELKTMANGGRGLMLIDLEDKDQLRRRGLHAQHPAGRHWPWRQGCAMRRWKSAA